MTVDEPDTRPEYSPVSAILDLQAAMRRAGLDVGRHTPLGYRGPAIEAAEGLLRALGVAPTHQERPLPLAPGDGAMTRPTATAGADPTTKLIVELVKARKVLGISQRALADIIGVTQSTFCNWEAGLVDPSLRRLAGWAEALGAGLDASLRWAP